MSNIHNERYDEIKDLLRKSRLMLEQDTQVNVGKDLESKLSDDSYETAKGKEQEETTEDKVQRYRISGGIMAIHGKDVDETSITTEDKLAFQETMDEFVNEVSDLVDFNQLNLYKNNVEWSGKIIEEDIEFIFTIGEDNGIYINGQMIKIDQEHLELINNLQQYYQKFKSRWGKVLASRKKTDDNE
jgi:hypothetical protein